VTLEVTAVAAKGGETIVTTKVDGNFDRTGLPDPFSGRVFQVAPASFARYHKPP
jgi:hypothetical protein